MLGVLPPAGLGGPPCFVFVNNPTLLEHSLEAALITFFRLLSSSHLFSYLAPFFPCGSAGKESACNEGDLGSIPGLGRSPGEGNGNPLQYSGLKNSMDYHGAANSRKGLRDFHFISLHFAPFSLSFFSRSN